MTLGCTREPQTDELGVTRISSRGLFLRWNVFLNYDFSTVCPFVENESRQHVYPKDFRSNDFRLSWQPYRWGWLDHRKRTFPCRRSIRSFHWHPWSSWTSWWYQDRIPRQRSEEGSQQHQWCKSIFIAINFLFASFDSDYLNWCFSWLPQPCWRKISKLLIKRLLTTLWSNLMALRTSPSLVLMPFWEFLWQLAKLELHIKVFPSTGKS